jgi:hypothetical protein
MEIAMHGEELASFSWRSPDHASSCMEADEVTVTS